MRVQTANMGFNNYWIISSSNNIQAHQQRSQWKCFPLSALLWFEILPTISPKAPDASMDFTVAPGLTLTVPDLVLVLRNLSLAPPDASLVVTKPSMFLQMFCQHFQVHLKATALVQSTLEFNHPGILVRQLPNTSREKTTICSCRVAECVASQKAQMLIEARGEDQGVETSDSSMESGND